MVHAYTENLLMSLLRLAGFSKLWARTTFLAVA
jgi:hypothetical protein